jgi:hypothetical protein
MNTIEKYIFQNIPAFTQQNCILALTSSVIFWYLVFLLLNNVIIVNFMNDYKKSWPCLKYWYEMNKKQKL